MDAIQTLTVMANLFERMPTRFSPDAPARDVSGNIVDTLANDAYSFNVHGFIDRATGEGAIDDVTRDEAYELMYQACGLRSGGMSLPALEALGREAVIATARVAVQ